MAQNLNITNTEGGANVSDRTHLKPVGVEGRGGLSEIASSQVIGISNPGANTEVLV